MWPNCIRNFPLKGKCREYLDVHNSEITIKSNNLDYNCYYNLRTVKIFQHKGRTKQKIFEGVSSPGTGDDSSSTLTLRTLLNRILLLLIWISLSPLSRCGCWLERIILVPSWDTKIKKYIDGIERVQSDKKIKVAKTQYWGYHQRFFKYLCISAKINETVKITKQAIKQGKTVVIGLQTTGDSKNTT